jgi:probable F420-dependent oxidoreductase
MARGRRPGVSVAFGIQGSGQHVNGTPDPGVFRELARKAEALGYDSIWAGDHISYRNPILDVVVALSTFAAVTEQIAIGAGVVLLPLRHPSVVAKEFSSLDYVSGGRVILGVGVGGEGEKDFEAVGVPVRERGARTNEAMRALRALFSGRGTFSGRFFSFEDIEIEPGAAQAGGPPLWVGGRSEAAIERAATLGDGWIPLWVSPERFAAGCEQLPDHVVPAVALPAHVGEKRRLYEQLRKRYSGDFSEHVVDRYCIAGSPEECAARLREYIDAGARHVVFNVCEPEDVERLSEVASAATG